MITPTEARILSLLAGRQPGCFASELIHMSSGALKRGSVYTLLNRLEAAGFVCATEEDGTDRYALPRTRYKITAAGIRARIDFGQFTGLIPSNGIAPA